MLRSWLFRLAAVSVACAIGLLAAGVEGAPNRQTFRSRSDLVVLHVSVFDGRSDAVPDLPEHAFRVFEDGAPQTITFFNSMDVPVAVGLVLDNSGSMIARHGMVVAGGTAFAASSHPEDEMFTVHFNENVQFGLPNGLPFTNLQSMLQAALARFRAGGKTAFHDAVIAGLDHVEMSMRDKHVLLVLSDGEDNASRHSEDEMMERARESNAIVYTVSNADRRIGMDGDPGVLRDLADATGGVAYFPRSDEAVVSTFDEIAGNIRRGYTIGYVSTNATRDGRFRRVRVTVEAPDRGRFTVRSRSGYTAPRPAGE